uniref:F-box/LRR-repeat protein 15/At3g58940/PEG3-like LRR domain-containing protein n=1 Tax=Aegilops tauschii TaxID=37682 RepID=N1QQ38_AEGTA
MRTRWLYHVLKRSSKELHLKHTDLAEYHVKEPYNGEGDGDSDSPHANVPADDRCPASRSYQPYRPDEYALPRRLFSCVAVRTLRLGACTLEPPERIELPFLETLFLSTIRSTGGNIQRLISGCPCLIDLTLERCGYTDKHYKDPLPDKDFTIVVLDKHLRRFSLRCCHNLVQASIDASELRTFEYRGDVPSESLLTLHGAHKISSCTISFCGMKVYKGALPLLRSFLE